MMFLMNLIFFCLSAIFKKKELMIVGDINCDFVKPVPDSHTQRLQLSCILHQLDQLITEPTRVTEKSATLIDLFLTNKPENISNSGVIHLGISNHSMIFAVKNVLLPKFRHSPVRDYKILLKVISWKIYCKSPTIFLCQFDDPNTCWQAWKSLFFDILDRHAPVQCKRIRGTTVPSITSNVKRLMRNRNFHRKQAIKHASSAH